MSYFQYVTQTDVGWKQAETWLMFNLGVEAVDTGGAFPVPQNISTIKSPWNVDLPTSLPLGTTCKGKREEDGPSLE